MKKENLKSLRKRLAALSLAGVVSLGALTGCGEKETEIKNDNALLDLGDQVYSFEIEGCLRSSNAFMSVDLPDGSVVYSKLDNLIPYGENTSFGQNISENQNFIKIETTEKQEGLEKVNMAMALIGNEVISFGITKFVRYSDGMLLLTLEDGTETLFLEKDIVLYHSDSKMMDQVEALTLKKH